MPRVEIQTTESPNLYKLTYEDESWNLNPDNIGDLLFFEALFYESLQLTEVGKHTSIYISGTDIHIHFRRELGNIKPANPNAPISPMNLGRGFSNAVGNDLSHLSNLLINDPQLKNINRILGFCGLGRSWGKNNGWETETYTVNPKLIALHESTIKDKPIATNPSKLTIFTISVPQHIISFPPTVKYLPPVTLPLRHPKIGLAKIRNSKWGR